MATVVADGRKLSAAIGARYARAGDHEIGEKDINRKKFANTKGNARLVIAGISCRY